ncbi:MAG: hypothetical protein ACRD28_04965, partial [Acidobacteriaceae bacterium]
VPCSGLEYSELAKSLSAAVVSFAILFEVVRLLPSGGTFPRDLLQLACGTAAWLASAWAVLQMTRSDLPHQLISRLRRRNAQVGPTPLEPAIQPISKI